VALVCLLAAYATILLVESPFTLSLLRGSTADVPLGDFGSFIASGRAAAQGLDPYGVYPLTMDAALGRGTGAAINLNAPISVVTFEWLGQFEPGAARLGWYAASVAAAVATVGILLATGPLPRGAFWVIWPFAMAGFWETIDLGQVYAILALLATVAWLLVPHRPVAAGVLIGLLAAFKPNFLVWPVLLLVAGQRRAGVAALIACAAFCLVPAARYGPQVYAQWLAAIQLEQPNSQVANASFAGELARFGAPPWVALALSGVVLAIVALRARKMSARMVSVVALPALLLASPVAWVGYTEFLVPTVFRTPATAILLLTAALLCIPRLLLQQWSDTSALAALTLGSAYTVAWVLILVCICAGRAPGRDG
jgi:hypothetical protein